MAARATNPQDKAAWLRLANDWVGLAEKSHLKNPST
jgi:hypothetical protein